MPTRAQNRPASSRLTSPARAAAVLALLIPALGAAAQDWGGRVKKEFNLTAPAQADQPVKVRGANGSIAVRQGEGAEVRIKALVRADSAERAEQVQIRAVRDGGLLSVAAVWPNDKRKDGEGVSFELSIPAANGLDLGTSNGAIAVSGLSGPLRADTSNGAISVKDFRGAIDADTSNGAVSILGATESVKADTSNGGIEITLDPANPGPVVADTSNGPITITIGPAFAGTLKADTSNSSITLPEGAQVVSKSRNNATLQFGSGGEESVLDTSNGPIRIQRLAAKP